MVSTRQTSSFSGGGESSGTGPEPGPSKSARHSVGHSSSEPSTSGQMVPFVASKPPSLLNCPVEILEKIFSYLPYKTIAQIRPVCRTVDSVCCHLLNTTFQRLQNQMQLRFQSIKAKMPRRESARRNHPLACESDIIETLHMRLTLLHMTFGKHIERKHCCFFAGEILDEVYRILHYIRVTPVMARPYKVTDELFDLSTMAMEYFKDYIEPTLPEINYFNPNFLDFASAYNNPSGYLCLENGSASGNSRGGSEDGRDDPAALAASAANVCGLQDDPLDPPPQSNMVLRKRIRKIKQGMKRYNSQLSLMRRDLRNCKNKIADQQKQILDYAARLDENDKKNEETSRKFSTLLQELNKCKTELQYWRSKSPANPPLCAACGILVAPAPPEELQALANQGALPQGLELAAVDFVPIAGTADEPTPAPAAEVAVASPAPPPPSEVETLETAALAAPVACKACPPSSAKRKLSAVAEEAVAGGSTSNTDDSEGVPTAKKARRVTKGRPKRLKLL